MNELLRILDAFLATNDWSVDAANSLEGQLDDLVEISGVDDLQDLLASYRPGGGEYLYDRDDIERAISLLSKLLRETATNRKIL